MSTVYNQAGTEAVNLLKEVMAKYPEHAELQSVGVTVDMLSAFGKEKADGTITPAIKVHGVQALACIKRTGLKERTLGHADALLIVDGRWWNTASEDEKIAVLDHELYHLQVRHDDTNAVEFDDMHRPKLNLRPHDWELGEFTIIARRHGMASQECKLAKRMMDTDGQWFWPHLFTAATEKAELEVSSAA